MEIDLKKVFYVIVAIGLCVVIKVSIVDPITSKIEAQKTEIETLKFGK